MKARYLKTYARGFDISKYLLSSESVPNSMPMPSMKVFPDGDGLMTAMESNDIRFWIPGRQAYFSWTAQKDMLGHNLQDLLRFNIPSPMKRQLGQLKGKSYVFMPYLLPVEKNRYYYIAYMDNDTVCIKDMDGRAYNSMEGLVRSRFGSIRKYSQLYKNKIILAMERIDKATNDVVHFYVLDMFNDSDGDMCIRYWSVDKEREEVIPWDELDAKYTEP